MISDKLVKAQQLPAAASLRYCQKFMPSDPSNFDTSSIDQSDADLADALAKGDVTALGIVYNRYSAMVYGLSLKILANTEEAADLTQDIFLMVWRQSRYDPTRGSLRAYLATLTRSRAIDRLRSRGTRHRFLQRWQRVKPPDSPAIPLERISLIEQFQQIQTAMRQLSEAEQEVLELAYFGGLSQSEIAQKLSIPLGTVKTRSRQGLLKLRRALQDRPHIN